MKEKIITLYRNIVEICVEYLFYKQKNIIAQVQRILPQIQEFAEWFLTRNELEIDADIYQYMQSQLIEILNDCLEGIKENDVVYLHDALDYGLREFIRVFIPESELDVQEDD